MWYLRGLHNYQYYGVVIVIKWMIRDLKKPLQESNRSM